MSDEQTNTPEQTASTKKQKHRSPNYPYIGLEDALTRTRELVGSAGIAPARITTAREIWGYQQGTGNQVVAALDAYNLITVEGVAEARMLKVTTDARKILDNTSDSPGILKQCALAPALHEEIWNHYNGELPPDDRLLREYLVYSRSFNPAYVDKFITQFRASLAFANVTASDKIKDVETPAIIEGGQNAVQTRQPTTAQETPPPLQSHTPPPITAWDDLLSHNSGELLSFNVSRTGKAQVRFNGQITQEGIRKLIALLDLSVDTYPTEAELAQPKQADSSTGIPEDELGSEE